VPPVSAVVGIRSRVAGSGGIQAKKLRCLLLGLVGSNPAPPPPDKASAVSSTAELSLIVK